MSHYCQYNWNSYLDYWLQHCRCRSVTGRCTEKFLRKKSTP